MVKKGDADAALKGAAKVVTAEYFSEHVSHVCMEPLNATVKVDGDKVEVWAGNQAPGVMQILASIGAGTTPDKVSVNTMLLGGGFGRRSDGDDVLHASMLAKAVPGRPVKMIWSRSDDMQNDKFRPLTRSASRSVSMARATSSAGGTASSTRPISAASCRRRCSRRSACMTWCRAAAAR